MKKKAKVIDVQDEVSKIIQETMEKTIAKTTKFFRKNCEKYQIGEAQFPILWNVGDNPGDGEWGKPINDPLLMRVSCSDWPNNYNARYEINLEQAINDLIIAGRDGDDHPREVLEDMRPILRKVQKALIKMANKIDAALEVKDDKSS